jgi:MFS family permease
MSAEPPDPGAPPKGRRWRAFVVDIEPLRTSREFRLLWIGRAISFLGSRVTAVALPFQIYQQTHSTLAVGAVGAIEFVMLLGFGLVGGALADSIDRRRLGLWSEGFLAVCSAGLALNATLDAPYLWLVYVLAAMSAALMALGAPALRSITPFVVTEEQLPAANALSWGAASLAAVAGPAVAGVLIGVAGLAWTYLAEVVAFAVGIAVIAAMRPIPPHPEADRPSLASIVDGFRFLRGRPVLQSTFLFDINAMVFGMPSALFPAVAESLGGGAKVTGLLYSAPAIGAFLAAATSGWTKRVHRQGLMVIVGVIVWGAAIAAFGFASTLPVAVLTLACAGAADTISGVYRSTILQSVAPPDKLGRLTGIELVSVASGPYLGDFEAGALAAATSLRFSIVSGGFACIAGCLLLAWRIPEFARYDARNPTP